MILRVFFYSFILFSLYLIFFILFRRVEPSGIIFYQGLLTIFFIAFLSIFFLIFAHLKRLEYLDKQFSDLFKISIVIFILFSYSFHITIPSLLDRSISLFMIAVTEKKPGLQIEEFRYLFYKNFLIDNKAIEKRLDEQIVSGNMYLNNNSYYLTEKGRQIQSLNIFFVKTFNADDRYILPNIDSR
jgi:hypothetical protein